MQSKAVQSIPPLEGVSVRLQVTNWRAPQTALLPCLYGARQIWDEILQHRTEGHNLAEMERRNDATSQSLEHRSHQRSRE